MSGKGAKPEVLPGDLITQPGLYESRGGDIVQITGWDDGWWVSEWHETVDWYGSDGRQRFDEGPEPNRWDLLHWVRPLPANEAEPETTTEQLAEIERQATEFTPPDGWQLVPLGEVLRGGDEYHPGSDRYIRRIEQSQPQPQPEPQPQPQPLQVREGRWRTRGGKIVQVVPTDEARERDRNNGWLWMGAAASESDYWHADGTWLPARAPHDHDLVKYLGPIEAEDKTQPQPQPGQVREGRWRTRNGDIRNVTPTPECDGRAERFPWWDAQYAQTWRANGRYHLDTESPLDLVEYLGPIEPQPEPVPADTVTATADELRSEIHYLQRELGEAKAEVAGLIQGRDLFAAANREQADKIGALRGEARDLNMEIGGLERQLMQRDARIRDLDTINTAQEQAVERANRETEKLALQWAAVREELKIAAAVCKQLQIELDAAQQVPRPVSDDERERIWDDATEQAGRQVIRWLRPLTLALNRQPDERFSRFMALTLSILPDVVPELLGYAVEDGADCEE